MQVLLKHSFVDNKSHIEIQLPVVSVIDPGDRFVRNFRPVRPVEQAAQLIADTVDADAFPGAVASMLRQPGQGLPYRAVPPQLPALIP